MSKPASTAKLDSQAIERRGMERTRVLLNAVIADENGHNAIDSSILDISATGAKIQSDGTLQRDADIYLVDTANQMAHLATVVWTEGDKAGLSFVRSYSLELTLPPRLEFLRRVLVEAKLRQVQALIGRGVRLEEAARVVGLREDYFERVGMSGNFEEKVELLLHQAKRLFGK
jgi:hypothetical protein